MGVPGNSIKNTEYLSFFELGNHRFINLRSRPSSYVKHCAKGVFCVIQFSEIQNTIFSILCRSNISLSRRLFPSSTDFQKFSSSDLNPDNTRYVSVSEFWGPRAVRMMKEIPEYSNGRITRRVFGICYYHPGATGRLPASPEGWQSTGSGGSAGG